MVNKGIRRIWNDRCDILVRDSSTCPSTGRTLFAERCIYVDLPCRISFRLSFETVGAVRDVANAAIRAGQSVKLFLAPEIVVPPGSKILVRRRGHEMEFARTGMPAVFEGHQEVRMERFSNWA